MHDEEMLKQLDAKWDALRQVSPQQNLTPCPYVVGRTTQYCSLTPLTLTDEEREAIKQAIHIVDWQQAYFSHAGLGQPLPSATLRSLLERTK